MKKWSIIRNVAVCILLIYAIVQINFRQTIQPVNADYPDGTTHRAPVLINYTTGTVELTNYQILITANTQTLIASNKLKSDCADLRFRDTNDIDTLSYWIESGCNTSATKIWVKVPKINPNTNKMIYMYYGNPQAPSASNGENTFDFFDDFNSFNSAKWTSTNGTNNYSISSGTLTLTAGTIYTNNTVATMPGFINEAQLRWLENQAQSGLNIASRTDTLSGNANAARLVYALKGVSVNQLFLLAGDGNTASYNIAPATENVANITLGTTYIIGTEINTTNTKVYVNRNEVTGATAPYEGWSGAYYLWLGYFNGSNAGSTDISTTEFDWVLTRKYAATVPTTTLQPEQTTQQYSLRMYGNGVNAPDADRVKIRLDNPEKPIDVSGDFTIEFWMKAADADNNSPACTGGPSVTWIYGNTIIDRDIYGDGDHGDYGISLYGNKIAFGASVGSSNRTICSTTSVDDNQWHHIAVTRNATTGTMNIFIDGVLDATGVGPTGDISYRNGRTTSYPNSDPYLVIGAEKHDAGVEYPSYNGYVDELRISNTIRYTSNFSVPTTEFLTDANTAGLYHFNEGYGTAVYDVSESAGGPSNGNFIVGGSPSGPVWSTDIPSLATQSSPTPTPTPTGTPTPTPGAPINLMVVGGNNRISARWSAPTSGGAPTDYIVEYRQSGGGTFSVFPDGISTTTSTTITGLTNGIKYDVRIAAANSSGSGPYTAIMSATATANELAGILVTGQSYASGYDGNPALTTTQPYENLRINAGGTQFVVLKEDLNPTTDNVDDTVESPMSALANTITAQTSPSPQFVMFNNSYPGYAYAQLKKGTQLYQNGINDITTANTLTTALNRPFRIRAIANLHGPADRFNAASYEGYLAEWQSDYQADISAITGQSGTIPMFIDQSSNFTAYGDAISPLVIAQYTAAKNNPAIYLIGPKYQFNYPTSDGIHLTNVGYRWLGEYYGKAIKRVIYDGESITALMPAEVVRKGSKISIRYNVPQPPITLDTTNVLSQTNYGFEYTESGTPPSISSVNIDGQDTVRIQLSTAPTGANQKIRYAYTGTPGATPGAQSAGSARGNLRDSDTTPSLYGNALYNWSVHFEENIVLDETNPILSAINATPTSNAATITWNTNEKASSWVQYGVTANLGSTTAETNTYPRVTNHSVNISGLAACTRVYYQAQSEDLAENIGQSNIESLYTAGCLGNAVVDESVVAAITTASGGTLSLPESEGRNIIINVPAGFAANNATFQILQTNRSAIQNAHNPPNGYIYAGENAYEMSALSSNSTKITNFNTAITITIEYLDQDVTSINEQTLKLFRWNGTSWQELDNCSNNAANNQISCTTFQFSPIVLFGQGTTPTPTPTVSPPTTQTSNAVSSPTNSSNLAPASCGASLPGGGNYVFRVDTTATTAKIFISQATNPYNKIKISYGYNENADNFAVIIDRPNNEGVITYTIQHLEPNTIYYVKTIPINDCRVFPHWGKPFRFKTKRTRTVPQSPKVTRQQTTPLAAPHTEQKDKSTPTPIPPIKQSMQETEQTKMTQTPAPTRKPEQNKQTAPWWKNIFSRFFKLLQF